MKNDKVKIEHRLQNMKNFYIKVEEILDKLPDSVSEKTKTKLKDAILGDNDLKELMEGIDSHRPPRIFLIGRTGVGKSSLINALCGGYLAKVSDTISCTSNAEIHQYKDGDRVLMEILDTRGIAESVSLDVDVSAEERLVYDLTEFSPDVAVFMLNCTHRDDVNTDTEFLKKVVNKYSVLNKVELPVVTVINKCDEMAPTRFKIPEEYPESKIVKINEVVQYYKSIIIKNGLKINDVVPVSSLIDWQTADGLEVGVEDIEYLPQKDIENLQIMFDGRYNIEKLSDILGDAIKDYDAKMGLRMAARLDEVVKRVANKLVNIFATLSATIAVTPIPVSDIYILIALQSVMVTLIAALSGRDVSVDSGKEFISSIGGVAGFGFIFRTLAQQTSKLINGIFPGVGSAVSSGVAFAGTTAMGKAAVAYYIEDKTMKEVKNKFNKVKKKIAKEEETVI